jgi:preprotein translocase subunit SecB
MTDQPVLQQPANVQIGLGAQYIKDFSFENPNAPQIFTELQNQPQMAMDVNVTTRTVAEGMFEAILKIRLESKIATRTAFIVELAYAGLFTLPEMPEEQMRLFLFVEAPRLLFPFARSVIANALREGGYPHVMMQPIDFYALYVSQRQAASAHTAGAA